MANHKKIKEKIMDKTYKMIDDNDSSLKYLLFKKASGSNSANKKKVNNLSSYCKMKI